MVDAKNKGTLSPPGRYCGRLEWRSWKQRLPIWSVSLILKSTIILRAGQDTPPTDWGHAKIG